MDGLLQRLRDKGNTILVVEHEPEVIRIADHTIDMGQSAGSVAGRSCSRVPPKLSRPRARSPRGNPDVQQTLRDSVRTPGGSIPSRNARLHNFQNVSVDVPLGVVFVAVTGVPGSGKSSLIHGCLPRTIHRLPSSTSPPAARADRGRHSPTSSRISSEDRVQREPHGRSLSLARVVVPLAGARFELWGMTKLKPERISAFQCRLPASSSHWLVCSRPSTSASWPFDRCKRRVSTLGGRGLVALLADRWMADRVALAGRDEDQSAGGSFIRLPLPPAPPPSTEYFEWHGH